MTRTIIIIFSVALLFVTCKKKDNPKEETYTPTCSGTKSFVSDVFPLIQSKCFKCHTNMSDYAQIKSLAAAIKDNVTSGIMPKDDKLTTAQKDIMVCWVEAGAPNN
ncbi:MAG: hypothetical protein SGJ15_07935 [Bacteroidota bacterium]|nr:hypothetical protein [Bacteroidota bacterium]